MQPVTSTVQPQPALPAARRLGLAMLLGQRQTDDVLTYRLARQLAERDGRARTHAA